MAALHPDRQAAVTASNAVYTQALRAQTESETLIIFKELLTLIPRPSTTTSSLPITHDLAVPQTPPPRAEALPTPTPTKLRRFLTYAEAHLVVVLVAAGAGQRKDDHEAR